MTKTLAEIRAKAREHEDEILSLRWFTPTELAERWRVSRTTVAEIPRAELPYKEFGAGEKLKRRRYREDWILEYEQRSGRGPATGEPEA